MSRAFPLPLRSVIRNLVHSPVGFTPVGFLLYVFPRVPDMGSKGIHRSVSSVSPCVRSSVRPLHFFVCCMSRAFPVSSLAFPERPTIRCRVCSPILVPDGFPFPPTFLWHQCYGFSHAYTRPLHCVCLVLLLVHFLTAQKPQGHRASVVHVTDKLRTHVPICSPNFCLDLFQRNWFRRWVYASSSRTYVRGHSVKVQKIKLPNNITNVKEADRLQAVSSLLTDVSKTNPRACV